MRLLHGVGSGGQIICEVAAASLTSVVVIAHPNRIEGGLFGRQLPRGCPYVEAQSPGLYRPDLTWEVGHWYEAAEGVGEGSTNDARLHNLRYHTARMLNICFLLPSKHLSGGEVGSGGR